MTLLALFERGHVLSLPSEKQRQHAFGRADLNDPLAGDEWQQPSIFLRNFAADDRIFVFPESE